MRTQKRGMKKTGTTEGLGYLLIMLDLALSLSTPKQSSAAALYSFSLFSSHHLISILCLKQIRFQSFNAQGILTLDDPNHSHERLTPKDWHDWPV